MSKRQLKRIIAVALTSSICSGSFAQPDNLKCEVPIHLRQDFGMHLSLVPANCRTWTDGCNRYTRLEDGRINRTLQQCFRCPVIKCLDPKATR
jgi:hypothetical protein